MARLVKRFDEINITPLTDIFLVLLIIMMVVAPMLEQQGLNLSLPSISATAASPTEESKILVVTVQSNGALLLNGKAFNGDSEALKATLKEKVTTYTGGIELHLHPKAAYEKSMLVMDAAQGAGITALSIVEDE
jgi:biopolymer transport protein ExbD